MTNRIPTRFAELAAQGRAAFVPYVMAGDPDLPRAAAILQGLPAAGADLIELGFPFSDPMAEGPPIQRAAGRALAAGATFDDVLGMVRAFRQGDQATPIVLMGYMNIVLNRGIAAFARDIAAAGADGLIVVDCPPEEADPLADALEANGVSLVRLATPTTDEARLPVVLRRTSGFVYYVSVAGVTGVKEASAGAVAPNVARIKAASGLPVAVGFGIRTPARAAEIAKVADAVVVGSALVDVVAEAIAQNRDPVMKVLETVQRLANSVRSARVEGSLQA
jgi:tryptophan synthase alpha chain